uniref:(northern house mosquito) hypothetical protein n=1 Tax=Culex pipiens TaxID=7175 RepID=A0A8D8BDU8_CULPI
MHHPRWPPTEATRNIVIRRPAWTSTDRTERPQPVVATEPALVRLREVTAPTGTAKAGTAVPPSRPQVTPPERSTMPVTTTTVPERTTPGIRPDTRKTTASRTARPPSTVQSQRKPTPASSMTNGRRIPATTRKPTRRAMQRPISTLMVVITKAREKENSRKQIQITMIERQKVNKTKKRANAKEVCDCVCNATKRENAATYDKRKTKLSISTATER